MPRNVRNFWCEMSPTDGTRAKTLGTGPVCKDGGLDITLYQRSAGEVKCIGTILGRCTGSGALSLKFYPDDGGDAIILALTDR